MAKTLHCISHRAMATVFEFNLFAESLADAQAAAEAAFEEIDALEAKLSRFIPSSDIAQLNAGVGTQTLLSADTISCLMLAKMAWQLTDGAFDPTVGARLGGRQPWDLQEDFPRGQAPADSPHAPIGFDQVLIDPVARKVQMEIPGMQLDLGAIGKGFALDKSVEILTDFGIQDALLSAGRSSMLVMGLPPGQSVWNLRLFDPRDEKSLLGRVCLTAGALSTSSVCGEEHILCPKTGEPVGRILGAWALTPTAAISDALSTALMVMAPEEIPKLLAKFDRFSGARFDRQENLQCWGTFPMERVDHA